MNHNHAYWTAIFIWVSSCIHMLLHNIDFVLIHRSKKVAAKRRKPAPRRKKKTAGVTKAIQTFFTDLFPSNETETTASNKPNPQESG